MSDWWWQVAAGLVGGLVLIWLVLVCLLYAESRRRADAATGPGQVRLVEAVRLVPDVVRLFRRLAADSSLPRGIRVRLGFVLVYLASPIDLIPDFIPVLGYADDALVVAVALRSVARRAGVDALDRHWPGTADGLWVIKRFAGLTG